VRVAQLGVGHESIISGKYTRPCQSAAGSEALVVLPEFISGAYECEIRYLQLGTQVKVPFLEIRVGHVDRFHNVAGQQQQVQNYARQLDAHEQQLAALRDRQAELQKKKSALEAELNKLIEALAF